jgi:hypothetical protein
VRVAKPVGRRTRSWLILQKNMDWDGPMCAAFSQTAAEHEAPCGAVHYPRSLIRDVTYVTLSYASPNYSSLRNPTLNLNAAFYLAPARLCLNGDTVLASTCPVRTIQAQP